ncbi:hypothetical protein ACHAWF_005057, partial [Thalassiosira exigua]
GSREIEAARQRLASAKAQAAEASQTLESSEKMKQSAKELGESAEAMLKSAAEMFDTARDLMKKAAKNDELARSQRQQSQDMMKAATKNSEVAQFQLKRSGNEIEEAQAFLKDSENRWNVIEIDIEEVIHSDTEQQGGSLANGREKKRRKVTMTSSEDNNESHGKQVDRSTKAAAGRAGAGPQVTPTPKVTKRCHLTPGAKNALLHAVLTAIRHPTGKVDEHCLQRAMAQGLPKQAILNAAQVALERDRRNREQRRRQREQQMRAL